MLSNNRRLAYAAPRYAASHSTSLFAAAALGMLIAASPAAWAQSHPPFPGAAAPGIPTPGSASTPSAAAPAMAAEIPTAPPAPIATGLLKQRIAIEDERQAYVQLAAAIQNRAVLLDWVQKARAIGITIDDIPLPDTAQTITAAADAHARQMAEVAARAKEQAAREAAAKALAANASNSQSQDTTTGPTPAQGGQSAGRPSTASPTASRAAARSVPAADPRPRWTEIGGVPPHFYAMIAVNGQTRPATVGDQVANGWTITAIGPKNVTAIDPTRKVHNLPHISAVD